MNRVAIDYTVFGIRFQIYWYSLFILLGALCGITYIFREVKRKKINEDLYNDIIFYGLIFGIIGARLYYVLFNYKYYSLHKMEIFEIWNGGLAIHGGIIFALITTFIYTRVHDMKFLRTLDVLAPGAMIAQSIGRWGNFFNQEAFGPIVSEKSLSFLPEYIREGMNVNGYYRAPMFLYECIWTFIGFIIMLVLRKKPHIKEGHLSAFYMIWYSAGRLVIEFFRTDALMLGDFRIAQIVSIMMIITGIIIIAFQNKSGKLEKLYNSRDTVIKKVKGEE